MLKTAKKAFDELGVEKLPTVKELQAEYGLAGKKAACSEYRVAQDEMRELLNVKANVNCMLGNDRLGTDKEKSPKINPGMA